MTPEEEAQQSAIAADANAALKRGLANSPAAPAAVAKPSARDEVDPNGVNIALAKKLIGKAKRTGLIARLECGTHKMYVEPLSWASANVDSKKGMALAAAASCDILSLDIYSYQSGRHVAELSTWSGFTVD